MPRTDRLKRRWFDAGADAISRLRPDWPRLYACPMCGHGFTLAAIDQLTFEHVPPASMGGRRMLLVCRQCNSSAGHRLDAHAARRHKVMDFAEMTMEEPIRARLSMDGAEVNVEVFAKGNGITLISQPGNSNPVAEARLRSAMDAISGESNTDSRLRLSLVSASYKHPEALLSLLRSAYLASFAALGYRYVFHKGLLESVRRRLLDPEEARPRIFSMTRPGERSSAPFMMIVERPTDLCALLVSFGRHGVFLPWPPDNVGLYDYLAEQPTDVVQHMQLEGKLLEWPRSPTHALDS